MEKIEPHYRLLQNFCERNPPPLGAVLFFIFEQTVEQTVYVPVTRGVLTVALL